MKSPTYNVVAHDKWASFHVRALTGVHSALPPDLIGTIKFPGAYPSAVKFYLGRLGDSIRYRNSRYGLPPYAIYGFLELANDTPTGIPLIHLHFFSRNSSAFDLEKQVAKIEKKHNIRAVYWAEKPNSPQALSFYYGKLGYEHKDLFYKGAFSRYTFQAGNYFLGRKSQFERKAYQEYRANLQVNAGE